MNVISVLCLFLDQLKESHLIYKCKDKCLQCL